MATNNRRVSDLKKAIIMSPPIPLPPELVNPSLSYWDLLLDRDPLLGQDLLFGWDLLLGQDLLLGEDSPQLSQLRISLFHFTAIIRFTLNIFDKMVKQTQSENSVWPESENLFHFAVVTTHPFTFILNSFSNFHWCITITLFFEMLNMLTTQLKNGWVAVYLRQYCKIFTHQNLRKSIQDIIAAITKKEFSQHFPFDVYISNEIIC